jgi:HAE1 family hydrophobic/amphiphilic exporter-1
VRLPPSSQRDRSKEEIEAILRKKFEGLAGLEVRPQAMHFGGSTGDVVVKVFSEDLDHAREYGQRLKGKVELVPGAADVTFSMEQGEPELTVDIDREQVRLLGLTPAEVASNISTYFLGTTATMYREGGDEYRVFVRAPREVREDVDRLRVLPLVTPRG